MKNKWNSNNTSEMLFLKSAFISESVSGDTSGILQWINKQNQNIFVKVERIKLNKIKDWNICSKIGSFQHTTKQFFSIEGIEVLTNWGKIDKWDQPIINQPEIGYLGFIVKEINGVLHFLMQAKVEPGNSNHVQLSPTIQATRSNYEQVHKGEKPPYLELFQSVRPENVLLDQLQSEQGARFLMKRNRNIIIQIEDDIELFDNYIWVTLGHLKELMQYDNMVNMDSRTVVSCINYGNYNENTVDVFDFLSSNIPKKRFGFLKSALVSDNYLNSTNDIIHAITDIKSKYDLTINKKSLFELKDWTISDDEISRDDGKYFKVIGVDVSISNREVKSWQQPMIQPSQVGLCAFVCKSINDITHFIVQIKLECGNRDLVELAPTVQCITGDYNLSDSQPVNFLQTVLNSSKDAVYLDTLQSEEGGRFYQENNRNMIVMVDENFPETLPGNFIWMTLNQLLYFNRFNNFLNIQARNLIATIAFNA
ncbi:MAG: NDP-hexose 2,3-dehydratase family protein [Planctomycetes bacterium]|nr:NDP-hexose 2,3-dehydratase family protein [Planctomycetota bacterium]